MRTTLAILAASIASCAHFETRMREDVSVQSGCPVEQTEVLANNNGLARVRACDRVYVCRRSSGAQAGYHGNDPLVAALSSRWDCEVQP